TWQTDLSGCHGTQGGRVLVTVWVAVAIRFVSRRPAPSRSGGQRLKALVGAPSSFFSLFLLSSPLRGGEASPLSSPVVEARGGAAAARAGREQCCGSEVVVASSHSCRVGVCPRAECALRTFWWERGSFSGHAVCAGIGQRPFWRLFPEGVSCVPCEPASPSHYLTLRWFRSRLGRSGVGLQFNQTAVLVVVFFATLLLTWLFGVSSGDTWLFLPDLVEVWDVGCLCRETLFSRGHSGVPCFHMSLTPLVLRESCLPDPGCGRGISLFPLLCSTLQ
ncbi:hypothetical protein Taro_031810, partial [Colocasia esculenta]|nr:hypothetical protein [Colocasia esculenta]